jgi:hypothetical protein
MMMMVITGHERERGRGRRGEGEEGEGEDGKFEVSLRKVSRELYRKNKIRTKGLGPVCLGSIPVLGVEGEG